MSIDDASPSQAELLFIRFYDSGQNIDLKAFGDELENLVEKETKQEVSGSEPMCLWSMGLSPAHIQPTCL